MGFDLYGMNPYNPNKAVKPKMDWDKNQLKKKEKNTLKKLDEYEKK